jgi:CHAD domain-containing protein
MNGGTHSRVRRKTQPVHSLHDAAVTLLDDAIKTLKADRGDEAIHATRKACKRLRAALRLLRECLGLAAYRRENRRVRDASKPLAAIRDAFILRTTLRSLPMRPLTLQRRLHAEHHRERNEIEHRGARVALERLMAIREQLVALPAPDSETASSIAGVARIYKAGREAFSEAMSREDLSLHEWRKQVKYLVDQLELLKTVFNAKFKVLHRQAHQLGEILGDDHDLGVLLNRLGRYEIDDPSLTKHIEKRRSRLQARAFQLGKVVFRRSAKHLEAAVRAQLSSS